MTNNPKEKILTKISIKKRELNEAIELAAFDLSDIAVQEASVSLELLFNRLHELDRQAQLTDIKRVG